MEALNKISLAAMLIVAALCACTAGTSLPTCADGIDRGLKSSGTCGPDVTVTVKSGASCVPSAFTGFNSELAGFPAATNVDHLTEAVIAVDDGGTESRSCSLTPLGDSGFSVTCGRCAADAGTSDAGVCALKLGTCTATLVP